MISIVVPADEIPWRPAMEKVLGILAVMGRARTIPMIRSHAELGDRTVRDALNALVHKGLVYRDDGRPAYYRINDHGRRIVARNPERFRL